VVSPTQVQFVKPTGVACDALFELANLGGGTASTAINGTPTVTSLPLSSGPAAGGANIFVIGANMLGATVTIGGAPMNVVTQTSSAIIGTTPPGTPGTATILVVGPNGCQGTATYTYL